MIPVDIQTEKVLVMSILQEETPAINAVKQISALMQITDNLRKINDTEPLPAEFDEILSLRIHFTEINQ